MDDQDLINLQQLVGRDAQPWSLAPETPDHILYARVLAANGAVPPKTTGPTPEQLMMADILRAHGEQTSRVSDPDDETARGSTDASTPNLQLASYRESRPTGVDRSAPAAGTQYAMGSPAAIDLPWEQMADQYATPAPKLMAQPSAPQAQAVIGAIPGYPETGKDAWRAGNDPVFIDAVNRYNAANGYQPGDRGYWTADKLKAQAMQESGGSRHAFETDPLQVNVRGDWDPVYKPKVTGLTSPDQPMTPQISAEAALKWLQYKGWVHDGTGKAVRYRGDDGALQRYNGHDPRYAEKVDSLLNAARQARRGD